MRERIIAVDVDECLAGLIETWVRWYNDQYEDDLKPEDIKDWGIAKYAKKCSANQFFNILRDQDFYNFVKPLPGAYEEVQKLRTLGRVVFLSSCAKNTCDQKRSWLERNGFSTSDKDIILATDKALIRADVLLDDAVHNVEAFPGHAFLVPHTHNESTPCFRKRLPGPGIVGAYEVLKQLFDEIDRL